MKEICHSNPVLVGVLLLICSCPVLGKTCSEGQYLSKGICKPCPDKQYMSDKNHTNEACIPCTIYDATYNVQHYEGCSSVSNNHITKCVENFYIKDGECIFCPFCSSDNPPPECCQEQTSAAVPVPETSTPVDFNVTGPGTTTMSSTGVSTANPSHGFNKTDSTETDSDSAFPSIIACVVVFVVILIPVLVGGIYCYKKKCSKPTPNTNKGALIKHEVSNDLVQDASSSCSVQLLKPEC
ncbi:uncharacterized protein LOC131941986 [Physella acuta]|uniref:uncharacterized protein LOC131941986 n=1 Tax=Physella acuta TaxID=109671 RepID=UPI0027DCA30F|nr:uncharacterized protein LOC131941986 [Physella acuta]XP_059157610.1 uncharacterized protein LOC131941986 [Physella acuta]XP_059157611.1 uncharacterized protein LOC131941986 [Physella acuta]XP_059157612.1 uncharacterized protein LOC131941986 [Physella acuta]